MPKKLDDLHRAIKQQLKKDNPNLSDKEIEQRAWAIAQSQYKKITGKESINEEKKYDEEGRIIVAENVKFYIEGGISTITE